MLSLVLFLETFGGTSYSLITPSPRHSSRPPEVALCWRDIRLSLVGWKRDSCCVLSIMTTPTCQRLQRESIKRCKYWPVLMHLTGISVPDHSINLEQFMLRRSIPRYITFNFSAFKAFGRTATTTILPQSYSRCDFMFKLSLSLHFCVDGPLPFLRGLLCLDYRMTRSIPLLEAWLLLVHNPLPHQTPTRFLLLSTMQLIHTSPPAPTTFVDLARGWIPSHRMAQVPRSTSLFISDIFYHSTSTETES